MLALIPENWRMCRPAMGRLLHCWLCIMLAAILEDYTLWIFAAVLRIRPKSSVVILCK